MHCVPEEFDSCFRAMLEEFTFSFFEDSPNGLMSRVMSKEPYINADIFEKHLDDLNILFRTSSVTVSGEDKKRRVTYNYKLEEVQ